jgi:hypothetical protein
MTGFYTEIVKIFLPVVIDISCLDGLK